MQLIIAEKPSVGMALAKSLGVAEKKDGYMEGNGYIVSWCVGHLVSLADADMYDEKFKKWNISDLPITPSDWQFVISADKSKQFGILKKLMNDSRITEVINACDAGREGELIFRLVYENAGCKKPIKRLWISSMEESAILDGFKNLRDGEEYEKLYQSALCRAKADWLVGINATRLFSRLYNKKLNVGRVMTPTLAMLGERDSSIGSFVKEKYFNVHLKNDYCDAVLEKVKEQSKAEKIKSECDGVQAIVKSVKREQKTINPPTLYDLTTLQREANRLYGFTAQQTLDYTQSLYESKLVTYPRTDSQFITEDMADTARNIVEIVLKKLPHFDGIQLTPDVQRVINNKKVTDHHAIIPTAELANSDLNAVPDGEKKILYLIANRLLCATSEKYVYETVTAEISCGGYSFVAKGKSVISDGWKGVEQKFRTFQKCNDDDDEEETVLSLTEGQIIDNFTAVGAESTFTYSTAGWTGADTDVVQSLGFQVYVGDSFTGTVTTDFNLVLTDYAVTTTAVVPGESTTNPPTDTTYPIFPPKTETSNANDSSSTDDSSKTDDSSNTDNSTEGTDDSDNDGTSNDDGAIDGTNDSDNATTNPATGDSGVISLIAIAMLSGAGFIVSKKKK